MDSISRKNKRRSGFRSYINEDFQERAVDVPEEPTVEIIEPFLFPGEIVIAEAHNVHKFAALKANQSVILGTLFVTNFKLSFVTASLPVDLKENELVCGSLSSDFLGLHDISLTEIDSIYYSVDGTKKKKIVPSTQLPFKIHDLSIILKNFRIVNFNFRLTPLKQDYKIVHALVVHRYPKKVDLFYLGLDTPPTNTGIPEFRLVLDWEKELQRTKCPNWRVSKHNENHKPFPSLPLTFVVPKGLTDNDLSKAANHFKGNRPPVWCWGTPRGAALVKMPQVSPNLNNYSSVENELIKMIHKCHSQKVQPTIMDLDRELPSLKSVLASYNKLKELHTPDSVPSLNECEKTYFSRWQSSQWLNHVRQCLSVTKSAASAISLQNSSVILQENEARDFSCVISCLVQILLDPYARTIRGFHSLIQKDWVALGHPFSLRLGHLSTEGLSPLWLLFLNCVHEISLQHAAAFEFSSHYLIGLWHAGYCSLHSTFMFDSLKEETQTITTIRDETRLKNVYFWPIWSWWGRTEGPRIAGLRGRPGRIKDRQVEKNSLRPEANADSAIEWKRIRGRMRQKFLNVNYVQKVVVVPLVTTKGVASFVDATASSYEAFHRLRHLLGLAETPLPYDPSTSVPHLELDNNLALSSVWICEPWIECFGMWISDPPGPTPLQQRPTSQPSPDCSEQSWMVIRDIYQILQKHYRIHCSQHAKWYGS